MDMGQKVILGTKGNDPEWINEIVSFLVTTKDKDIINDYKRLFREFYFDCLKKGLSPKETIEKVKKVVIDFKLKNKE